ncbi:MAG: hypothetical protein ACYTGH_14515 [Planctomycetota bacterium]
MKVLVLVMVAVMALGGAHGAEVSGSKGDYRLAMSAGEGEAVGAIRYHERSGESWYLHEGHWTPIKENAPLKRSRYTVKISGGGKAWVAIRMNIRTGQAWRCTGREWVPLPQPKR